MTGFNKLMITIRGETSKDLDAIRHVVEKAFGQTGEARLVEGLRQADALITSLVAVAEEQIVGHIAFSALAIVSQDTTMNAVALAPLAVLPAHQRRASAANWYGAALIIAGAQAIVPSLSSANPHSTSASVSSRLRFTASAVPSTSRMKRSWLQNCFPAHRQDTMEWLNTAPNSAY